MASQDDQIPTLSLEDFIPYYPPHDTAGIQRIVATKEEFRELTSEVSEVTPERGEAYRHQLAFTRLMTAFDVNILIIDEMGTGKTCKVDRFLEFIRAHYFDAQSGNVDVLNRKNAHYKKCFILVHGDTHAKTLEREIICKCTKREVFEMYGDRGATKRGAKKLIRSEFHKWYSIQSYYKFANTLAVEFPIELDDLLDPQHPSNIAMIEKYSDTCMWIDEAHFLVNDTQRADSTKTMIMQQLLRYHTVAQRTRMILTSGTPIRNRRAELITLMALIHSPEKTYALHKFLRSQGGNSIFASDGAIDADRFDAFLDRISEDQLEPFFRGSVAYIRALKSDAVLVEQGDEVEEEILGQPMNIILNLSYMLEGSIQEQTAMRFAETETADAFYAAAREISNFVYPDGSWGSRGFNKYVRRREDGTYFVVDELKQYLKTATTLRQLSAKYADICDQIRTNPGNTYVYNDVIVGSGLIILSLCLQYVLGYVQFTEQASVFDAKREATGAFCSLKTPTKARPFRAGFKPAKRFAFITAETQKNETAYNAMMELMNSWENRHGTYLQILLLSPVAATALSISNVLNIHMSDFWTAAEEDQVAKRGLRSGSHDHLIEERKRQGLNPRIEVKMWRHAVLDSAGQSINLDIRTLVLTKSIRLKRMMNFLKRVALDYYLNRQRNIRPDDVDYSYECNYQPCNYQPFDALYGPIDWSTYNIFYANRDIDELIELIIPLYIKRSIYNFLEILHLVRNPRPHTQAQHLLMALSQIIASKQVLYNQFGQRAILNEDEGSFYLAAFVDLGRQHVSSISSYYMQNLIGTMSDSLAEINNTIDEYEIKEIREQLLNGNVNVALLSPIPIRAALVEEAIVHKVTNVATESELELITALRAYIFETIRPTEMLTQATRQSTHKVVKQGRPKATDKEKIERLTEEEAAQFDLLLNSNNPHTRLWLHTIFSGYGEGVRYGAVAKEQKAEGRIRILSEAEQPLTWRDLNVNSKEYVVYNKLIQYLLAQKFKKYAHYPIYGFVARGEFKIKLNEAGDTGKECANIAVPQLIKILYALNIEPPNGKNEEEPEERDEMITRLKQLSKREMSEIADWDDAQIAFWLHWYEAHISGTWPRGRICEIIKKTMSERGLIVTV